MRPDLRLVGFVAGTWAAALGCLWLSARAGFAVAALSTVAVAGALLAPRLRSPTAAPVRDRPGGAGAAWGAVVVSVLAGVICGAAVTAARVAVRDTPQLRELAADRAVMTARLTLTDDPRLLAGSAGRSASYLVRTRTAWLDGEHGRLTVRVRLLVLGTDRGWAGLLPGTAVEVSGRLAPSRGGDLTAAVLNVTSAPGVLGPAPRSQRAAGALRTGLVRACVPLDPRPGGLLPGLVVGDTSRLPDSVAGDFTATGMTHLVAVSGANLAIIGGLVLGLVRWCRAGPRLAVLLCALSLAGFVVLARPSPSVLRAAAMAAVTLAALALGRQRTAVPALAAATAALLLIDPALAPDAGFALSVCATGGLLLLAPGIRDWLRRHRVPAGLAEALAVPAAAQLACSPVIAGISATVSLAAVPANLLAEPAVAPATVLGVGVAVVAPVWPAAAGFLAWLASWPAWWLVTVAHYGAAAPGAVLPWPAGVAGALLMAVLLVAALLIRRRPVLRLAALVCAAAVVVGALPVAVLASGWPPDRPLIVACDVGQGDAIVLPVASGHAVLIDTGPEPRSTAHCLADLGVSTVDLLVLTHFHADHIGGVAGVFAGRRVRAVLVPGLREPPAGVALAEGEARAHGVPVITAGAGWHWVDGPLSLTVLGPVTTMRGTDSDPNNNSLVLRADIAGHRLLLAGDAETPEQAEILAAVGPDGLRADVLKLAHHGSAKQDNGFLDAVRPAVALVSVAADNGYGLPNAGVLARLSRSGVRVARTDLDGDCAVVLDHGALALVRHGRAPPG